MKRSSRVVLGLTALGMCSASTVAQTTTCPNGGAVVAGVGFSDRTHMAWEPPPDALAFNVYVDRHGIGSTAFAGECLYWAVPECATLLHGRPRVALSWMFQVTGLFQTGEGPRAVSEDCVPQPPPRPCTCTLPPDLGPCIAVVPRWFFNFRTGGCEGFSWGGCAGNANNFETPEACEAACMDPCKLPAVVGPCDDVVPRWYFSVLSGHCEPFTYGGCGGNANNFPDVSSCRAACGDLCGLPPDPGPCDGFCPRWYSDPATGRCEMFVWGCCGGNANNFVTRTECEAECVDICGLPADPGPCDGVCPRWFHDAQTGQCRRFVWGCCGGNGNNFQTQEACEAACP